MAEVAEIMKKLGIDKAKSAEAQDLDDIFKGRQAEMEREAHERLLALEKQRDEISKIAKEKQEELEKQLENQRKLAEIDRAKKALEAQQRKEIEEQAKKGQMSKQQMEELIAQHQKELAMLESTIGAEKERQMAVLKQKLDEKKAKRIKALQVPEDLKHINVETAQLLKGFRGIRHGEAEFDDDILSELLRRVSHVEKIIANIDQKQFTQVLNGLNSLKSDLKKL